MPKVVKREQEEVKNVKHVTARAVASAAAKTKVAADAETGKKVGVKSENKTKVATKAKNSDLQTEYYRLKEQLLGIEEKNYSKIYFLWQRSCWFRAFGHSALIYHYDIAPRLKRNSQLFPDRDYGVRSPEGVVNIRDMEALTEKLTENGYQKIAENMYYRVFNAGRKYSDAELRFFQESQHKEMAAVNSMVVPSDVFPHLLKLLRQVGRMVFHRMAKMDRNARELVGGEVAVRMDSLLTQYSLMTKYDQNVGGMSPDEYLQFVKESMVWLQAKMGTMLDFRLLEATEIQKILILTGKILREVGACQAGRERK